MELNLPFCIRLATVCTNITFQMFELQLLFCVFDIQLLKHPTYHFQTIFPVSQKDQNLQILLHFFTWTKTPDFQIEKSTCTDVCRYISRFDFIR